MLSERDAARQVRDVPTGGGGSDAKPVRSDSRYIQMGNTGLRMCGSRLDCRDQKIMNCQKGRSGAGNFWRLPSSVGRAPM